MSNDASGNGNACASVSVRTTSRPRSAARRDNVVADACLDDYHTAAISDPLRATLAFLETMTLRPDELQADQAQAAIAAGVTRQQLADSAAVAALFNIITRYANALDFAIPTGDEFDKAAGMMLKRGYA